MTPAWVSVLERSSFFRMFIVKLLTLPKVLFPMLPDASTANPKSILLEHFFLTVDKKVYKQNIRLLRVDIEVKKGVGVGVVMIVVIGGSTKTIKLIRLFFTYFKVPSNSTIGFGSIKSCTIHIEL